MQFQKSRILLNLSKIKQVVKEHYEIDNTDRWIEDTYEFMLPNYHTNLPSDYKHNVDKLSLYNTDMILNEHWFRSDTFDTNGDGQISRDELANVLKSLGEDVGEDVIDYMME